jgi:hypothetical protein
MIPLTAAWFERRLESPNRLLTGLSQLVGIGGVYTAALFLLWQGGARPGTPPWLAIPAESYFRWETVFIGPVIAAGGLLAASILYLAGRALGGVGSFDDCLALTGTAIGASTLVTAVPDLVIGLLLVLGVVDAEAWMRAITHPTPVLAGVWVYLLAYAACFLVSFSAVASAVHRLSGWRPIVVGAGTFAIYQFFLYLFIR